jgi:hypothetical protein
MLKANEIHSEIESYKDQIDHEEVNTFFGNGIDVNTHPFKMSF